MHSLLLTLSVLFLNSISIQNTFAASELGVNTSSPKVFESGDAFNRKYKDIQSLLKQIETKSPHLVKVFNLGLNDTGQMIQGVTIGTGSVNNLVVGTHHGNEYGATELALALITHFAENPIPGQTIHIIPVLNVSGYDRRERREIGQDPNRDYPGPCGTDGPFKLRSTKLLADYIAAKEIVASATLHTFSPAVLYPWGFSTHDVKTEYDDLYIELGNAAAQESKYEVGNSALALYPADGCYEDYAFWKQGVWSLLFELGYSHSPNQTALDDMIRTNVPGIHRFFEKAPRKVAEKHEFVGKCDVKLRGLRTREE